MNDDKKRKSLYDYMLSDNYDLPDYEQFSKDIEDEVNRKRLYENLLADNYDLPDYDQFSIDMGFGIPPEEAAYPEEVRRRFHDKKNKGRNYKDIEQISEEYDKEGFTDEQKKDIGKGLAAGASIGGSVGDMLSLARKTGEEAKKEQEEAAQPEPAVTDVKPSVTEKGYLAINPISKESDRPQPTEQQPMRLQRDPAAELGLMRAANRYAPEPPKTGIAGAMEKVRENAEVQKALNSGAGEGYEYQGMFGKPGIQMSTATPMTDEEKAEAERRSYDEMLQRRSVAREEAGEEPSVFDTIWKSLASGILGTGAGFIDAMQELMAGTYVEDPSNPGQQIRVESYESMLNNKRDPITRLTNMMHKASENLSKEAQPKNGAGFIDMILDGDFMTALQKGLAVAGESLPYTLSAYNPYTLTAMAISMAGSNYRQNTLEDPYSPAWLRASQAIGSAAIEQAVEKYADPVFKYIGGRKGAKATVEVLDEAKKTLTKRIYDYTKSLVKDAAGEGTEEIITNVGNDLLGETLDFVSGREGYSLKAQYEKAKKENKDLTLLQFAEEKAKENIEAFIGGALSGAYTSAVSQTPAAFMQYANDKNTLRIANAVNDAVTTAMANGHQSGAEVVMSLDGDPHELKVGNDRAAAILDASAEPGTRAAIDRLIADNTPTDELTVQLMNLDPAARQAAVEYIQSRSSLYGAQDAANDDVQKLVASEREAITPNIQETTDDEGNVHKTFTTVNYNGQMVYVRNYDPSSPYIHIVDPETGEVRQIIKGQDDALDESSIQTYEYDQYMSDFERRTEEAIGQELEERMAHNRKTNLQMEQGSLINSENGQMYVFSNDGETVQLLPTQADAETNQIEPVSGQPITMKVDDAVAMQDAYNDGVDYGVPQAEAEEAPVEEAQQEELEEASVEVTAEEAAVEAAAEALRQAGLNNEIDVLNEGGRLDTNSYSDDELNLLNNYLEALIKLTEAQNRQQEAAAGGQAEGQQEVPATESALSRIPKDDAGNYMYESAPTTDTYDALVEQVGKAGAMSIAQSQAAAAKKTLDDLTEQQSKGELKGKTVQEQIAEMQALQQAINDAQAKYDYWIGVQGVPDARAAAGLEEEPVVTAEEETTEEAPVDEAENEEVIPDILNDTPEAARRRGKVSVNGVVYERQEKTDGVYGRDSEVIFGTKAEDKKKGKMKLVPLSQVQSSHTDVGPNPLHFIPEAQPKDRTSEDSKVAAITNSKEENFDPSQTTGDGNAYLGTSPTVNTHGEVIQGNGRVNMMKNVYGNPVTAKAYLDYLKSHAEEFGFTPEQIDEMAAQQPVLVNELDVDDAEAIRLGQFTSQDLESGGEQRINPSNFIKKAGENFSRFINVLLGGDEEMSISQLVDTNGVEALKLMGRLGVLNNTELVTAIEDGKLTAEGKNDIMAILKARLFEGQGQDFQKMFDELPVKAQRAILSTYMRDLQSPEGTALLPYIQESVKAYYALSNWDSFAKAKNKDEALSAINEWKKQQNLFESVANSEKFSNFALELAAIYKGETQKKATQLFDKYYDSVQGKKEVGLFDENADTSPLTMAQAVKEVFNIDLNTENNETSNSELSGSGVVDDGSGRSEKGEQGGTETSGTGESVQEGTGSSDGGGRVEGTGSTGTETGSTETGEGASENLNERERFIAEHPLTEAEIDASDAPNARKNSAKRYLNGTDESPLAKAAYLSIYNKKPKITATEPETAGTTDEGNAAADAAKAKLQAILARLNQHKKKPNKDGVNEYSIEALTPEQVDDMLELVEAGAEYGYQILDAVSSKKGWKEQISDVIKEPLQNATGYTDQEVDELIEDIWNSPYENEWGDTNTIKEYAEEKGIDINDNENGNEEGNDNSGVQAGESGSDVVGGTAEGSTTVSTGNEGSTESSGETSNGEDVSGGNRGSSEGQSTGSSGSSGKSGTNRGTSSGGSGRSNTGRSNGGTRTNDGTRTGRPGESATPPTGESSVGRNPVESADTKRSSQEKLDAITKEKVPYKPASAGEKHAIGSVIPSGIVDAISGAFKRLKESLKKKSVLDFVREELGYKTNEELLSDFDNGKTDGLASEQVDAVALAIQAMKDGKSFIVGDMTGVGKGRTAAALIRWGIHNKKKVLFITEKSRLFSDMHRDLTDIGCDYLPFVTNSDVNANITDSEGTKVIPKPSPTAQAALWQKETDELPTNKKGRKYDFVMTTYSQASNPKGASAKAKLEWLKNYAKDAIVIMDESHNASGESNRGEYFREIVEAAGGVTFLSATYAKRPDNMLLYAMKSSMSELHMSVKDMLAAIKEYGVAMQELMASALFGSGEMIRRERDMSDVKTHWEDPKTVYSEQEYEDCRKTSDKTMAVVNAIIEFQREYVNPIVKAHEEKFKDRNIAAALTGGPQTHAANTSYKSQVSNVMNIMVYAMKAKKAAEMAIEQIKAGKKPVIAVEHTLGSYVDELGDTVDSANFGLIFEKGIRFALRYSIAQYKIGDDKKYHKDEETEHIYDATDELDENGERALKALEAMIKKYIADDEKIDLSLSPIDLIKRMIADAGYNCGEITGRSNQLVLQPDGTYKKEPFKTKGKDSARRFNGGSKSNPLSEKDQYQALVLNVAGASGISLHSSKTFGNQQPRTMIILQPARDVNTEVQMRGRIDRTGQVHRGEYYYLTSPVPAEEKITMMLKQKLASLDAQSVGTKDVSSNKVESQDMDNKYGDEVCKNFLLEHLMDINAFLEGGLRYNNKTREWEGRPGLLYDVLKDIQRMPCEMQESIIKELSQRYADQIDYLNQNGINDLESTAMNLEAVTIDEAIFVKGKDNNSISEFAHDTNIERVEVNVLKKPMRSSDINKKMKQLNSLDEDGLPKVSLSSEVSEKVADVVEDLFAKRKNKYEEQEKKLEESIRASHPKKDDQTDEEYEKMISEWPTLAEMKMKHSTDLSAYDADLTRQKNLIGRAAMYLQPGMPCLVPLTDDVSSGSPSMYGRFIGFQMKNGDPRQVQAVFAVKDSRSMISVPVVNQWQIIEKTITDSRGDYELVGIGLDSYGDQLPMSERSQAWDKWWDGMIPKNTNRQIRYMITGNVVQACGSLGKYKGQIVTFTRKNPKTGEITLERGMLLAENFDPENFQIRKPVEKADIWDSYGGVRDDTSHIYCYRSGDYMYVEFSRQQRGQKLINHPAYKDETLKGLTTDGEIHPSGRDEIYCVVSEKNVEKVLEHLGQEYGYGKDELFVMPDSTEKPDAIVPTDRPWREIIDEYSGKYGYSYYQVDNKIKQLLKKYKMDVNNDNLKEQIREAVQLRQAYLRKDFSTVSSERLAWQVLIFDEYIEREKDDKQRREYYYQKREAAKEELAFRGFKGTARHLEQGKMTNEELTNLFNELNDESTPEGRAKKLLFDKIMKKVEKIPSMEIALSEKIDNDTGGHALGRMIEYNWKYMNADYISDQAKADTILHELLHTMTHYAVQLVEEGNEHLLDQEMVDAVNELQNIYETIKNDNTFIHDGVRAYGLENVHEMLSEAGSNSQFREDLKKTGLWAKLKSGFLKFFGIKENVQGGKQTNAFDEIMDRLDYLIENFNKEAWDATYKGTKYGSYGKQFQENAAPDNKARQEEDLLTRAKRIANEQWIKAVTPYIEKWSDKLGIPIHVITDTSQIPEHLDYYRRAIEDGKGYRAWYVTYKDGTDDVYIYVPNTSSYKEIDGLIMHEIVAHKGLKGLLGEEGYKNLCLKVYDEMSPEEKEKWRNYGSTREIKDDEKRNASAGDEYIANLAETMTPENSTWDRIVSLVRGMLRKLGVNLKISNEELSEIVRESYRNLTNPDPNGGGSTRADDDLSGKNGIGALLNAVDRRRKEVTAFREATSTPSGTIDVVTSDDWDRVVSDAANQLRTTIVDMYTPLKRLQEMLSKKLGIKITDTKNVHQAMLNLSSLNLSEMGIYDHMIGKRLSDAAIALMGKKAFKKNGEGMDKLNDYMYAKHAVERNREKAMEDYANSPANTNPNLMDLWYQDKETIYNDPTMTWREKQEALDTLLESYGVDYHKTPSMGLAAMFDMEEKDDWRTEAYDYVEAFERSKDPDAIKEYWDAVRAATDYILDKGTASGMYSQDFKESQHKRWQYYVPLRGFDEVLAQDVYAYAEETSPQTNGSLKATMKGRRSKAGNIFGAIVSLGYSSIIKGNENLAKQRFLNLAREAQKGGSKLMKVNETWAVKYGELKNYPWIFDVPTDRAYTDDEYVQAIPMLRDDMTPDEAQEKLAEFYDKLAELEDNDDAARVHGKGKVPYRTLFDQDKQHQVVVYENGKRYTVTMLGDNAATQALNGMLNPGRNTGEKTRAVKSVNRFMSSNFTSRNPAFAIANVIRDSQFASNNVWVKENMRYIGKFFVNLAECYTTVLPMFLSYQRGKLTGKNDLTSRFREFMENGGPIGYTFTESQEDYAEKFAKVTKERTKQIQRLTDLLDPSKLVNPKKALETVLKAVEEFSEASELINRFAAYKTSREMGRSITRSILDAHEVSINFAQKGAASSWQARGGKKTKSALSATSMMTSYGQNFVIFFNANIQGRYIAAENLFANLARGNTGKAAKALFSQVAIPIVTGGVGMAMLNDMILPAIYQALGLEGDDDDDKYYDELNDYTRQNKICLRLPGHSWLTVPIDPEAVPMWTLGDLLYNIYKGRDVSSEDVMRSMIDAMAPVAIDWERGRKEDSDILISFIPSVLKPAAELMMNQNFMGYSIYKEDPYNTQNGVPKYKMVNNYTSDTLVKLSELSNRLGGGNSIEAAGYKPGKGSNVFDWNPAVLQHILKSYAGGIPETILGLVEGSMSILTGGSFAEGTNKIPLVSRFYTSGNRELRDKRIESAFNQIEYTYNEGVRLINRYNKLLAEAESESDPVEKAKKMADYESGMEKKEADDFYTKQAQLVESGVMKRIKAMEKDYEKAMKGGADEDELYDMYEAIMMLKESVIDYMKDVGGDYEIPEIK